MPDNEIEKFPAVDSDGEILSEKKGDAFALMTDRALLEYNARTLAEIIKIAYDVRDAVQPMMDKINKNPLLRGMFGG